MTVVGAGAGAATVGAVDAAHLLAVVVGVGGAAVERGTEAGLHVGDCGESAGV